MASSSEVDLNDCFCDAQLRYLEQVLSSGVADKEAIETARNDIQQKIDEWKIAEESSTQHTLPLVVGSARAEVISILRKLVYDSMAVGPVSSPPDGHSDDVTRLINQLNKFEEGDDEDSEKLADIIYQSTLSSGPPVDQRITELERENEELRQRIAETQALCGVEPGTEWVAEAAGEAEAQGQDDQRNSDSEADEYEGAGAGAGDGKDESEAAEAGAAASAATPAASRSSRPAARPGPAANTLATPAGADSGAAAPLSGGRLGSTQRSYRQQAGQKAVPHYALDRVPSTKPPSGTGPILPPSGRPRTTTPQFNEQNIKIIKVRQLEERIDDILRHKVKYDKKCDEARLPHETMEEYLVTYLNLKYGFPKLIMETNNSIMYYTNEYKTQSPKVDAFASMLVNRIDEQYLAVQASLARAASEFVAAFNRGQLGRLPAQQIAQRTKRILADTDGMPRALALGLVSFLFGDDDEVKNPAQFVQGTQRTAELARTRTSLASSPPAPGAGAAGEAAGAEEGMEEEEAESEAQQHVQELTDKIEAILDGEERQFNETMLKAGRRQKKEMMRQEPPTIKYSILLKMILDAHLQWHREYLQPFYQLFVIHALPDEAGEPTGAIGQESLVAMLSDLSRRLAQLRAKARAHEEQQRRMLLTERERARLEKKEKKAQKLLAKKKAEEGEAEGEEEPAEEAGELTEEQLEKFLKKVDPRNVGKLTFSECIIALSDEIDELHNLTFKYGSE